MARIDGTSKVTGKALYADDLFLDRMLHARPVHAEHAHAELVSVDAAPALAVPGVVDVLTATGVPGMNRVGGILKDHYVLAFDKTRYVGDVVAVVAAETPAAARAGARAVRIQARPLEPLLDPERAAAPDAPKVHPERKDNVFWTCHVRQGDPGPEFAGCDVVLEREWRTQYVEHSYMEPEACVAVPEPDGSVSVHGGMQHPFTARRFVSWATGLPLASVRIVQTTLGGGFGGKDDTISIVRARRDPGPAHEASVKLVYTRESRSARATSAIPSSFATRSAPARTASCGRSTPASRRRRALLLDDPVRHLAAHRPVHRSVPDPPRLRRIPRVYTNGR